MDQTIVNMKAEDLEKALRIAQSYKDAISKIIDLLGESEYCPICEWRVNLMVVLLTTLEFTGENNDQETEKREEPSRTTAG